MKYLFLDLSILYSSQCLAQDPNPDLFQTWYLQDMFLELVPPLELLDPPVFPYLEISENLDYSGLGSCNTFSGTYMYDPVEDILISFEFNRTNIDCVFQYHNQFESQYFTAVRGGWYYEISDDGIGQQLYIYNLFELSATFTNYSLSTPDIGIANIAVYPNPSNSEIFIESRKDLITKIELLNLLGESLQLATNNTNSIDISGFSSGIYLLRIFTEQGSTVKKIIKK